METGQPFALYTEAEKKTETLKNRLHRLTNKAEGLNETTQFTLYYPKTLKNPKNQTPISQAMKQSARG